MGRQETHEYILVLFDNFYLHCVMVVHHRFQAVISYRQLGRMLGCLAGMWMGREETNEYIYILVLFDHLHNTSWWYTSAWFAIQLWTTRWVVRSLLFARNFAKI
jgi:hypothetical protein